MQLHSLNTPLAILGAMLITTTALPPLSTRDALAYRSWDLRLFNQAIPTCNVNDSNPDLTIWHRYGRYDRSCQALEASLYNATNVKSLSWKSPIEEDWHDLCLFRRPDCEQGSLVGSITDGWEVCYPYAGWMGWMVVSHGAACGVLD